MPAGRGFPSALALAHLDGIPVVSSPSRSFFRIYAGGGFLISAVPGRREERVENPLSRSWRACARDASACSRVC